MTDRSNIHRAFKAMNTKRKFNYISPKQGEYNVASDGTAYVRIKGALRKLTPEQLAHIKLLEAQGQTSALPTT